MKFQIGLLGLSLLLVGCEQAVNPPIPELDSLSLQANKQDAVRYLGEGAELIAVCGGSAGVGYYLQEQEKGFVTDEMSKGFIAFANQPDGSPDIVHRDALKEMIVVSESGASVTRVSDFNAEDKRLGVWIVAYSRSGIVETYNLTMSEAGEPILLWNANKAENLMPARTFTFVANCEFN